MTTRQGPLGAAIDVSTRLPAALPAQAGRRLLRQLCGREIAWLDQVHGCTVVEPTPGAPRAAADALVLTNAALAGAVQTADCLPVLFCDRLGRRVAAAHAGWRGLCSGVLEATVARLGVPPGELLAWLGAAIGPQAFEVGDEVRAAFLAADAFAEECFVAVAPGKWLADLYALARRRLARIGVGAVFGGGWCTHQEVLRFYSHRRSQDKGRMAALIWLVD
ncbi:MAG: peptidoglycan editing factor PgeF [Betaproteobacteria bacterium]|nr:peptidoglycan editing factor PgeF [Betaproteobacteria bacterium]